MNYSNLATKYKSFRRAEKSFYAQKDRFIANFKKKIELIARPLFESTFSTRIGFCSYSDTVFSIKNGINKKKFDSTYKKYKEFISFMRKNKIDLHFYAILEHGAKGEIRVSLREVNS